MVRPYDSTTLFCPSGMQQYKSSFSDLSYSGDTIANIQSCIRMNDFDEIGDASHLLYFNMIGLFSFRDKSVAWAIDFWMEFLTVRLGLKIGYVTLHQDTWPEWMAIYDKWSIIIKIDNDNCTWSDGNIGGYCTEFFIDDIEIGNIVNPLGTCIDVGFGLERLEMMVNGVQNKTKQEALIETIVKILESGYKPGAKQQGYVLRKLIRELYIIGGNLDRTTYKSYFTAEIERQVKIIEKYHRLKERFSHMPKEWWYDTHGINLDEI